MTPKEKAEKIIEDYYQGLSKQVVLRDMITAAFQSYEDRIAKLEALSSGPSEKLDEKELEDALTQKAASYADSFSSQNKETMNCWETAFYSYEAGYRMAIEKLHRYEQALKTLSQTEPVAREALRDER